MQVELMADNPDASAAARRLCRGALPDSRRRARAVQLPTTALLFRKEGLQVATVDGSNHIVLKPIQLAAGARRGGRCGSRADSPGSRGRQPAGFHRQRRAGAHRSDSDGEPVVAEVEAVTAACTQCAPGALLRRCLPLAACSLMPRYQPPANPAPAHYQQFEPAQDCSAADRTPRRPPDASGACQREHAGCATCSRPAPGDRRTLPISCRARDWWREFGDPDAGCAGGEDRCGQSGSGRGARSLPAGTCAGARGAQRAVPDRPRRAMPTPTANPTTDRCARPRSPSHYHDDLLGGTAELRD